MKIEFVDQVKPDVRITMSYKQAQKLLFVLLRVNGDDDLDDLWEELDNHGLEDLKGFKFANPDGIEVTTDE